MWIGMLPAAWLHRPKMSSAPRRFVTTVAPDNVSGPYTTREKGVNPFVAPVLTGPRTSSTVFIIAAISSDR